MTRLADAAIAEDRPITMDLTDSMVFQADGLALLRDWSLPHFYFHAVTAYDIPRHAGVELGKRDYLARGRPHPPESLSRAAHADRARPVRT